MIIWWGPKVSQATIAKLQAFYNEQPIAVFGTPYASLGDKIALTAWTGNPATYYKSSYGMGHIAICPSYNAKAFTTFRDAYRGEGPEGIPPVPYRRAGPGPDAVGARGRPRAPREISSRWRFRGTRRASSSTFPVVPFWRVKPTFAVWPGFRPATTVPSCCEDGVARAVHRRDPLAGCQARLGRGGAGQHLGDVDAVLQAGVGDRDAEKRAVGVRDLAGLRELVGDVLDGVARDREADSGRRAAELRICRGERRDADHGAVDVDECAARVAGVDRCARLDRGGEDDTVPFRLVAVEGADDAFGEARLKAERVADRHRDVADAEIVRVGEARRVQA